MLQMSFIFFGDELKSETECNQTGSSQTTGDTC